MGFYSNSHQALVYIIARQKIDLLFAIAYRWQMALEAETLSLILTGI